VSRPTVGIVGGGILGMTAAYRLAQEGVHVALYERSSDLGGLVGSFDFDGRRVDRFYHVILPTDDRVVGLADELGLKDTFRFRPTQVGFYGGDRLFSMTTPKEFLQFPILRPWERARLAAFVARCQLIKSYEELDDVPLLDWLRRMCGNGVVERLWKPLLDSKFDGKYDDLPATYIWARTKRMSKTRDKGGREVMGWLEGGYQTLIDALARKIRELGGEVHPSTVVDEVRGSGEGIDGLVVEGSFRPFDHVLCTLAPPVARKLMPAALVPHLPADPFRYLGVVCLLLRTRRSVSPYYHLNITDRRIPLTTVVETTHVVDPEYVGGSLLYVSKYVDPSHPDLDRPDDEVERDYLGYARTMLPDLRDEDILGAVVQRARLVEPVHPVGGEKLIPEMFPVPGLTLASTAHVYPEIVSGQASARVSERAVAGIREQLSTAAEQKAAA
jgi:protoporphyrinogen oxidase